MASSALRPAFSPVAAAAADSYGRRPKRALLAVRASQGMDGGRDGRAFNELGLYSLRKRIEDTVLRVEMTTSSALDMEEARRVEHEEMLRDCNMWDDPSQSYGKLAALADAIKAVDGLKDLRYKAEEAKLISQLVDMGIIEKELVKQAYVASQDASKFLDHYEMLKLLTGSYDKEGACVIVEAGSGGTDSELWAEKLFYMYTSWAEKHNFRARITEYCQPNGKGIALATVEFEAEYMYGYLSGEKGTHRMICDSDDDDGCQEYSATVDVIPLFLDRPADIHIDANDMEISSTSEVSKSGCHVVSIRHIPSGITVRSSGERSKFANELKAVNRLKAKLLNLADDGSSTDFNHIEMQSLEDRSQETRRYIFGPRKLVQDLKTGIELGDLNSVLDGNIEPLIRGIVNFKHGKRTQ